MNVLGLGLIAIAIGVAYSGLFLWFILRGNQK